MKAKTVLNIGILCGGKSIEREVSLNSGRTVHDHLDTERFCGIPIFQALSGALYLLPPHFLHRGKTTDFEHRLASEARCITWDEVPHLIDFAFIAMHGRYAEDGALQGMLELLGIPYFGSKVFGSALGMNKLLQKKMLKHAHIEVPADIAHQEMQFPCVVKPAHEGSSLGISVVHTSNEFERAVEHAAHITPGIVQPVVVEEYLQGMEFTCIIITDAATGALTPLSLTEIVPEAGTQLFDYEQKYMPGRGRKCTPARCTPEQATAIYETCIRAMRALHMTQFARIDGFLLPDGRVVIIDANSLGGMAPSSFTFLQAAEYGMSHTDLINHLVYTGLQGAGMVPARKEGAVMEQKKRIRIAVLMGGASAEREISLESGRNVTYKLSPHKYEVIPLFVDQHIKLYKIDQKQLVKNSTAEIAITVEEAQRVGWGELAQQVDFVFIALHGGCGENGALQGALELLQLPYNGSSVAASALCMDKYATGRFLHHEGFSVPRQLLLTKSEWEQGVSVVFPVIVKPHDDGCSVLVQRADNHEELQVAVQKLFAEGRTHALIEECLSGMELTVGVLGNDEPIVLPPSQAVATCGILSIEEKFLPGAGENQTPAPLPAAALQFVQQTIGRVYKALGCQGYARIDCFYQSAQESPTRTERLVILECNSLPGLTPATCIFHQAAEVGMKPMEFIDQIVQYGFESHAPTPRATASAPEILARAGLIQELNGH